MKLVENANNKLEEIKRKTEEQKKNRINRINKSKNV